MQPFKSFVFSKQTEKRLKNAKRSPSGSRKSAKSPGTCTPEVHGKVVDFISHTVTDGTLYVSVRFMDETNFSIRYASNIFVVGVDLSDWKSGDLNLIREYIRPIPR